MRHCVIEGQAWKSEGIETNSPNAVFVACSTLAFLRRSLRECGSQAAPSHRSVVFTLEGLPLDAVIPNNPG